MQMIFKPQLDNYKNNYKNFFYKLFAYNIILIIAGICFSINVFANNATTDNTTNELMTLLNNITTMQANFTQNTLQQQNHNQAYTQNKHIQNTNNQTTGTMFLQRPGKFRWEVTQPMQQLIIANRNQAWFYDVDLQQVTKQKLDINQAGNPAQLLSGDNSLLQKTFTIDYVGTQQFSENIQIHNTNQTNIKCFKLKPKQTQNTYQYITLCFIDNVLIAMQMADHFDNINEFSFSNIKINEKINNNLFVFNPPKNVDVIEQ